MQDNILKIDIEPQYRVSDTGTSDGTQIKFFYTGKWYKIDRYGGEGICEELVSKVLELSDYAPDKYVTYRRVMINGEPGCVSDNFLQDDEFFVTFYRLHMNIKGNDPAELTSRMDYDDAIDYMIDFIKANTGVDVTSYLADIFTLDALILNEDRHYNNLGLIFNGKDYRCAPIFDNGKSLFVGNAYYDPLKSMADNRKKAFAKAFSGSFEINRRYLEKYSSFTPNIKHIKMYLETQDLKDDSIYSRLYKLCNTAY